MKLTEKPSFFKSAALGEELKPSGAYLVPMVPKQKYRLMNAQGRPMAVINLIVSKSGSETATLFAMNQVDVGLASSTAMDRRSSAAAGPDPVVCSTMIDLR